MVSIEACENGLIDCATPIIIKGEHIATLATGQLLLEPPDISRFKLQAKKFGFNEKEYLKALREIPIVSPEKLNSITLFLGEIASVVSGMGYSNLLIKEEAKQLEKDITNRKRAEAALRENEEKYRGIFDESVTTIYVFDDKKNFINSNQAGLDLLGYSRDELMTMSIPDVDADPIVVLPAHQQLLSGGRIINYEHSLRRKDGSIITVLNNSKPLTDSNGKVVGMLSTLIDITERKLIEKELIQAKEKAEESDRLKSSFLANLSHEIRTPMNGIMGFANLLKEPRLTGDEKQEFIKIIEKSGARMLNIINDLVDISKIESGHFVVSKSQTNINEQINYLYSFYKPEAGNKGLKFFMNTTLRPNDVKINTDGEKVYKILTNLLKNAIKYTNSGSIELGCEKKGTFLEFYVKDTGIGIAKDRQAAIFNRFVQADISDKNALQGAGLGLSIAKAYTEMLGGKIWVESEEGHGSVFYFTLPCNTEAEIKPSVNKSIPASKMGGPINKLKILIAEDESTSDLLITLTLKELSRGILHAHTGFEAVETCRNNPDIDLVLMDIKMPEMDGYDATMHIREFNKDVIIIAQTAYALWGDREKAIEAGCNEYIAKPFSKDELLSILNVFFTNS